MPTGPVVSGKPCNVGFIWDNGCQEAKNWCESISPFFKVLAQPLKPLGCAVFGCGHSDWKPVLQQLLVIQFLSAALIFLVVFLLFGILVGFSSMFIQFCIQGVIRAFIFSWFVWYCLSKRETACCCIIVVVLEHPLVGVVWGVCMAAQGISLILQSRIFTLSGHFAGWIVFIGMIVYGVLTILCGVAAVRVGMAESGIEAPAMPNTGVGKAEEKPAAAVEETAEKPTDNAADAV